MRLASTMMCHCCGEEAEGIQHLLLRCPWPVEVWRELELEVDWQQGPIFFTFLGRIVEEDGEVEY